ncbi:MAG: tetratricopeptide repeat protein [Burkholderiales bacterium]|nr:tetratricopeptide repeat protein [Burkholderiales bacterium]
MITRAFNALLSLALVAFSTLASGAAGAELEEANRLYQRGDTTQALQQLDSYLATKPKDAQARFLKGVILTDQKKTEEAIKAFTSLTEDYPELPEPYNNLAVLYASLGQYDRAKTALELAIRTHPSYATAHENLGDIYAQLASRAYDKALQLDKNNLAAQTKLSMIKELFGTRSRSSAKQEAGKPQPPKQAIAAVTDKPPPSQKSAHPAPTTSENKQAAVATVIGKVPPAAQGLPAKETSSAAAEEVLSTVRAWAKAWSAKDVRAYLAFYSPDLAMPKGQSRRSWEKRRTERLQSAKFIQVDVAQPKVTLSSANEATIAFRQNYRSNTLKSSSTKTLNLVKAGNQWLIKNEKTGP